MDTSRLDEAVNNGLINLSADAAGIDAGAGAMRC